MAEEAAAGPTTTAPEEGGTPPLALRVASLLPSTTDICIALGIADRIVGVTHECDFGDDHPLFRSDGTSPAGLPRPPPLTVSGIDPARQSQLEIDKAVSASASGGASLYRLDGSALAGAAPTVVLTQSLCGVCAVDADDVRGVCALSPGKDCRVVSLEPRTLDEVAATFVSVADACGVRERGVRLASRFREDILRVSDIAVAAESRPRVLYLEWLDPPYDAGHWIPEMIDRSGCRSALPADRKSTEKSVRLTWDDIYESDPDVVVVGCCGFDLGRNVRDALAARDRLEGLRAFRNGRVYAVDGSKHLRL